MQTLQERLKPLLESGLPDGEADLETLSNGHVCGHVISSAFEGLSYADRRQRIRAVLDRAENNGELTAEDIRHVSTLLTYTPAEWSVVITDS